MPASPADRLKAKQPRRITVGVYLDDAPADRYDAFVLALFEARAKGQPEADLVELKKRLDSAQEALDQATGWFTFQGLGRSAFARLLAEHPPTEAAMQKAAAAGQPPSDYNPATFAPALIAASCLLPTLTEQDVLDLYDDPAWNDDELGSIFAAALAVNTRARPLRMVDPE